MEGRITPGNKVKNTRTHTHNFLKYISLTLLMNHLPISEVFFLFRLHDYDRSGHMDGLEMMKLLSEYNSHNAPGEQSAETVCVCIYTEHL